eukprot:TRINITY_DN30423_c0_g1_i1.p1 TRINITY_DN30423_c0_g1~~TRINITY_DN30423_c0_g1_i1.p1  ORF type:complete len:926 (+),score=372.24 TRINITY_DN30423_c0_g1_i1:73-2778(+)
MATYTWYTRDSDSEDSSSDETTTSSSDSESSSSSEEAAGLKNWLKKDPKHESAESGRVARGTSAPLQAARKISDRVINLARQQDWQSALSELRMLERKAAQAPAIMPEFLSTLKEVDSIVGESKEGKMKQAAQKKFRLLKSAVQKLMVSFKDDLEKLEEESSSDTESETSSSSTQLEDYDIQDDEAQQQQQAKGKPKKAKEQPKDAEEGAEEKKEEWSAESIAAKLDRILEARGRKSTDRVALVKDVNKILAKTKDMPHMTARVLSVLLSCQMDLSGGLSQVMPTNLWRQCYDTITRLMNLLQEHPLQVVDDDDRAEQERREEEGLAQQKDKGKEGKVQFIGTYHHTIERLAEEYTKSLQQIDPHTQDFVMRLRDEGYLLDITERVFLHYRDGPKTPARMQIAARMAGRLMDHVYYRHKDMHKSLLKKQRQLTLERKSKALGVKKEKAAPQPDSDKDSDSDSSSSESEKEEDEEAALDAEQLEEVTGKLDQRTAKKQRSVITDDIRTAMRTLNTFIQRHAAEEKQITKSMLQYIYHLALHDDYNSARDLLLMSRHNAENPEAHMKYVNNTQLMILYNRVLAQIGLAAFRAGEMYDANYALNELCANARTREYLAQTIQRSPSRDKVEENVEKSRLVPFHMHINTDLLDGVHLIAATLQEVPIKAQYPHDNKHRPASKALQRLLHGFSHQVFLGPPETTKELIFATYNALSEGNWREAHRLVSKMTLWTVMRDPEPVKAMITERIKICALRTYLFTFSRFYASVHLGELAQKYELPDTKVQAVVSKMIIRQDVNALWDQPRACITVESVNATKLQYLALQLADRCGTLVQYNEERQAEKEARGERGFIPYNQQKAGGRRYNMGGKWESGAAGAARSANTTFKYNRTLVKHQRDPFAQRRWGK